MIVKYYNDLKVENGAALTVLSIGLVLVIFGIGQVLVFGLRRWKADQMVSRFGRPKESSLMMHVNMASTPPKWESER